jgi:hypothetical protein
LDWARTFEVEARTNHTVALRRYLIRISFRTAKLGEIILQAQQRNS